SLVKVAAFIGADDGGGDMVSETRRQCTKLIQCFFFSSRRRHTRSTRDWSSDVCSSDLTCSARTTTRSAQPSIRHFRRQTSWWRRSEERRAGKECRSASPASPEKKESGTSKRKNRRSEQTASRDGDRATAASARHHTSS